MKPQKVSMGIALTHSRPRGLMGWGIKAMYRPVWPPGKATGTRCIGGWMSPRAGLDGCGKSLPPPPPPGVGKLGLFNPRYIRNANTTNVFNSNLHVFISSWLHVSTKYMLI